MQIAKRIEAVEPSATLKITSRAKQMRKDGVDVVNFGAGEPDFDTPQPVKDAAIEAINKGRTKYTPSSGIPDLKARIVKKFKEENNIEYGTDQIIVSCGAKHSLFSIMQVLINKGDQVLIPAPYWVSYPEMVTIAQGKAVTLDTKAGDRFKIDINKLRKKINASTKLLILNAPSNPAGVLYSKEELLAIATVCVENNVYMISDEIYEKILFDGATYTSLASLADDIRGYTFTVNGVSKSFSMTGWRIGYFAGPREIVAAAGRLQDHSTSCPCSVSQYAALAAFDLGPEYFSEIQKKFQERRDFITQYMDDKLKNFISYLKPQGAFYIFLNIGKSGLDSFTFTQRLLEESHVAVIPGQPFGCSSWIRVSFATSLDEIKKGLQRLELFLIKLQTEKLTKDL